MAEIQKRTYAEMNHWRDLQRYLPGKLQLTADREPVEEWWSWQGASIHLDRHIVPDAPLTVIALHGGGGNGRLLAPYGALLKRHGYQVVCPDLPGYGLSEYAPEMFTYQRWVDCAVDLTEAESQRTGKPVVLFGLSMGGYLAYMTAAKGRKAAGIMITTLCDPRLPIVRDQFARSPRLNRILSPLMPVMAVLCGGLRLPVKWLGNMAGVANDPEILRQLYNDPVGASNKVPIRFMNSILTIRPALEPEDFDVCPVLLAHPAADRWTTVEASKPFFDRIKGPKELVMLENCGHLPVEEPGLSRLEEAMLSFLSKIGGRVGQAYSR